MVSTNTIPAGAYFVGKPSVDIDNVGAVFVEDLEQHSTLLDPRTDLIHHSDGFAWSYYGAGPAQLALAMLCKATGNDERSIALHQVFKSQIVAGIPRGPWRLSVAYVQRWVEMRTVAESRLG